MDILWAIAVALMYGLGDFFLKLSTNNTARGTFIFSMGVGAIIFLPFIFQAKGIFIYVLALLWILGETFYYGALARESKHCYSFNNDIICCCGLWTGNSIELGHINSLENCGKPNANSILVYHNVER